MIGIIERHGRVEGYLFVVGEAGYRVVVDPPSVTLSEMTVKLLNQFVLQGGSLVVIEPVPFLINGQPSEEISRLVNAAVKPDLNHNALVESVSRTVSPSISISDREGLPIVSDMVNIQTLRLDDSYLYYLVNPGEKCYPGIEVTFHRKGTLTLIDLESGDIRPLKYTGAENGIKLKLTLHPAQSYVIRLVPMKDQLEPG